MNKPCARTDCHQYSEKYIGRCGNYTVRRLTNCADYIASPQAPASLEVCSNALLNCPFCGAIAGTGWVKHNSTKQDTFQIGCSAGCVCEVEEDTEAEAVRMWNRRAV